MHRTRPVFPALVGALALAGCIADEDRVLAAQASVERQLAEPVSTKASVARQPVVAGDVRGALRIAVEHNDAYRAARHSEAAAWAAIGTATSSLRPQLTGSALAGQVAEGSPSDRRINGAAVDIMLTQLIYDGGATRATIDEAAARVIAASAAADETGNRVALEAYRAWTRLWLAQQRNAMIRTRMEEVAKIMDLLGRMTDSGMVDSSMREGARLAEIDLQMEQARLDADLAAAQSDFTRHFGPVAGMLAKPVPLVELTGQVIAPDAWQRSPTLRRAAAEVLAADAAVAAARAARKPTVSLNAGVASPMDTEDTTDASVGFQLRYTFNDGGRRKAQISAAEARLDALRATFADMRAEAHAMLAESLSQLAALERATGLVGEKVAASSAKADTAAAQISLGQSDLNEVMAAQIGTYRAAEQQLALAADRLNLQAEIAAGTGQLLVRLGIASDTP